MSAVVGIAGQTMSGHLGLAFGADAAELPTCHWYVLADAAQHSNLPAAISAGSECRNLFGAPDGSPLAEKSPYLVSMPTPSSDADQWKWMERHARRSPCVTVLASHLQLNELFEHLQSFTEVVLPDGDDMFFAFWDPAILGTLVGQADDATLHVPGPVLSETQRGMLMNGVSAWWYWDRDGALHHIKGAAEAIEAVEPLPLALTQAQVDILVEASVPDHLLHYVELNQPQLLQKIPQEERYSVVRSSLKQARSLGLSGMGDLVNFVCARLIYGDALKNDPGMSRLLEQVRQGELTLDQAMDQFP